MSRANYSVKKSLERLLEEYSKFPQEPTDNPFAAWGMSENDHTKLLVALLKCSDALGGFPVMRSFLTRFTNLPCGELNNLKATFNQACGNGYIDGYITFKSHAEKYAVIIENKVYDAPDQNRQVQRYIEHALKDISNKSGDKLQHIWVLYITRDGSKTVSEDSYSVENQESSTNIGDRFVEINYKEHIIDWLTEVIEDYQYPESVRTVAKVYLEYLKFEFRYSRNLSHREKQLLNAMSIPEDVSKVEEHQVRALYDLRNEIQDVRKKRNRDIDNEALNNISSALSEVLLKLEKLAFDNFERVTKLILDEWSRDKRLEWKVARRGMRDRDCLGYLQIRLVDEWNSAHMEWDPIGVIDMLFGTKYQFALHLEGHKNLRASWIEELNNKIHSLPNDGEIGTNSRLFKWTIITEKPFGKMDENELNTTLTKYYLTDAKILFSMLIEKINEYTNNNTRKL